MMPGSTGWAYPAIAWDVLMNEIVLNRARLNISSSVMGKKSSGARSTGRYVCTASQSIAAARRFEACVENVQGRHALTAVIDKASSTYFFYIS